jgi:hypothetical protein
MNIAGKTIDHGCQPRHREDARIGGVPARGQKGYAGTPGSVSTADQRVIPLSSM